jgi:acid stress-induced BolA-like protein IbaG/YrbA
VTTEEIQKKIEQAIPGARARVAGSDAHFEALVVADAFEGKSLIERHQMVYAAVRAEMASEAIHALSLKTATPAEAS